VDQVEFADVILVNKMDLEPAPPGAARRLVGALNPSAQVIATVQCQGFPLDAILRSNKFDMARAANGARWKQELLSKHVPETLEYGVRSLCLRSKKPLDAARVDWPLWFSAQRLAQFRVVRSKGFFWQCQDDRVVFEWSSAGRVLQVKAVGLWKGAVERDSREEEQQGWRDRKTELVFIGVDLDVQGLTRAFEDMLCHEEAALRANVQAHRSATVEGFGEEFFQRVLREFYQQMASLTPGLVVM
jgi:G3E family GTPase